MFDNGRRSYYLREQRKNYPLHFAACIGNVNDMGNAVTAEALCAFEPSGTTPFHLAALSGSVEALTALNALAEACGVTDWVNLRTKEQLYPLHYASSGEVVRFIIEHGGDVDVTDNCGRTPLHTFGCITTPAWIMRSAALDAITTWKDERLHQGNFSDQVVAELLIAGADVNAVDSKGQTPLHTVPSVAIAQLLLTGGSKLDAVDAEGYLPIEAAGSAEIIELLVAAGCRIRTVSSDGQSSMIRIMQHQLACNQSYRFASLLHPLIQRDFVFEGSQEDYNRIIETVLTIIEDEHEIDADAFLFLTSDFITRGGLSVDRIHIKKRLSESICGYLEGCCGDIDVDLFTGYLEAGANPNYKGRAGNTPLHLAVACGASDAVELLIKYGGDVNIKDDDGCTAYGVGLQNAKEDEGVNSSVYRLLLPAVADVDEAGQYDCTLLNILVEYGDDTESLELIRELVARGASVMEYNYFGYSPLMVAIGYRYKDKIDLLLQSPQLTTQDIATTIGDVIGVGMSDRLTPGVLRLFEKHGFQIPERQRKTRKR